MGARGAREAAIGHGARLAAADKPTVVELSGDDLDVAQVRDAWRAGGAPRSAAEEEKVFEDLNSTDCSSGTRPTSTCARTWRRSAATSGSCTFVWGTAAVPRARGRATWRTVGST